MWQGLLIVTHSCISLKFECNPNSQTVKGNKLRDYTTNIFFPEAKCLKSANTGDHEKVRVV